MKIAWITMSLPEPSEAFALTELRALRRAGAEVRVFALRPRAPGSEATLRQEGLGDLAVSYNSIAASGAGLLQAFVHPVRTLALIARVLSSCVRAPGQLVRSLVLLPRVLAIVRELEAFRPEVVHLFWGHYPSLVAWAIRGENDSPVISQFLGSYDLDLNYGCATALAPRADLVWTHARANLPGLSAMGVAAERLEVVYRGVEVERVAPRPRSGHLLVTAGRLIPEKGMDDTLRVFARVHAAHPETRLVVLGEGPEDGRLHALAAQLGVASAVDFRGHVPHDDALATISSATIMLLMSRLRAERLPNVIKEAMLHGCVPVTTRTLGIEELIEAGANGFLVDPADVDAAVRAVERLLEDRELHDRYGGAGRAAILDRFDVDRNAHRVMDAFRAALR